MTGEKVRFHYLKVQSSYMQIYIYAKDNIPYYAKVKTTMIPREQNIYFDNGLKRNPEKFPYIIFGLNKYYRSNIVIDGHVMIP